MVDAVNISYIAPRNGTGGVVKGVFIKKGDYVKRGQLLLQLDDIIAKQTLYASEQSLCCYKVPNGFDAGFIQKKKNLWDQGIGTEIDVHSQQKEMPEKL